MSDPLISIVTVTYHDKIGLEKTIKSVLCQTYKSVEYIIIDGGSTDGTIEIIKKYEDRIDYWISEPDSGIYDAMNKGIDAATGDFVIFMNSNDTFYTEGTVETFARQMSEDKVYFGRANIVGGKQKRLFPGVKYSENNIKQWLKKTMPNHQAMFFPKSFYKNTYYNLDYPIGSDSDYKFEAAKQCGLVFVDEIVCNFELGGVSSEFVSWPTTKQILKDSWSISKKHKGIIYAIERQIKNLLKYVIKTLQKILRGS